MTKEKKSRTAAAKKKKEKDIVTLCSEDSFPASDPPSWTGTTAKPKPGEKEFCQPDNK